jgi:hypothetical protein
MRLGPEHGLTRRGLADLLNGSYVVPQNPLLPACSNGSGLGLGDLSSDLSQFTSDLTSGNITQAFGTDTISGVPVWIWFSGGIILYMFFFGGGKHSRGRRAVSATSSGIKAASSAYGRPASPIIKKRKKSKKSSAAKAGAKAAKRAAKAEFS